MLKFTSTIPSYDYTLFYNNDNTVTARVTVNFAYGKLFRRRIARKPVYRNKSTWRSVKRSTLKSPTYLEHICKLAVRIDYYTFLVECPSLNDCVKPLSLPYELQRAFPDPPANIVRSLSNQILKQKVKLPWIMWS